jgi:lipopolysaccharide transport protein LptA
MQIATDILKHLNKRIHLLLPAALLALSFLPATSPAQLTDRRLPVSLNAESMDIDGKNSMLLYRGMRVTQGNISIVADEGRASKLDFEDSIWHLTGNVIIDAENGHVECETADLRFSDHQLQVATITGSPATFRLKRPDSDQLTYAEAGRLEYDLARNIIEFSENATITEGGNEISSSYLLYNITEQRINARSNGEGDEKVKVIYTPGTNDTSAEEEDDPPASDEADDDRQPAEQPADERGDGAP